MRKATAVFIILVVFMPLAFAAMTMASIRPWIFDRSFYERLVQDERLYEPLQAELPTRFFEEGVFNESEQLPMRAVATALREVITPAELRAQFGRVLDEVFDYMEGRTQRFEVELEITAIKARLAGEDGARFALSLASALPVCDAGQEPIAPDGTLTRCIASDTSVSAAADQIAAGLPAALATAPDRIVLSTPWYIRMNWYDYALFSGFSVRDAVDGGLISILAVAIVVGVFAAILGGDDVRGRLRWLSSSLFFPASLFVVAGGVLVSPQITAVIGDSIAASSWNGVPYSDTYRAAVAEVVIPLVQEVGNGVLLVGIVVFLTALALLIVSWFVPARGQDNPRIVQVPAA
ncbi:MAG: hypothetical protein IPK19_16945 [Chloroflexi bacterium]|nr:hypothetical protein [Chloroflexota bacterium]